MGMFDSMKSNAIRQIGKSGGMRQEHWDRIKKETGYDLQQIMKDYTYLTDNEILYGKVDPKELEAFMRQSPQQKKRDVEKLIEDMQYDL